VNASVLSPRWASCLLCKRSHGLHPFDRLRAGCGLQSFAASRLELIGPESSAFLERIF
jgi:hypothetical protein